MAKMTFKGLEKIPPNWLIRGIIISSFLFFACMGGAGAAWTTSKPWLAAIFCVFGVLFRFLRAVGEDEMDRRAAIYRAIKYNVDQRYQTKKGK